MRRLLALPLLIAVFAGSTGAQDNQLEPGQTVSGTITGEHYAYDYTFAGESGQAVIFEMHSPDVFQGLNAPVLELDDPTGREMVSTADIYQVFGSFGSAYIGAVLPMSGDYTLIATRADGASGGAVGDFTVTAIIPQTLEMGVPVSGTVSSNGLWDYYYLPAESDFEVRYTRPVGEYWPEVAIYALEGGAMIPAGILTGDRLTRGVMGTFDGGQGYFITVGQLRSIYDTSYYYLDIATADYTLTIEPDSAG